ncbi:MAG: site-specific integrase [Lachnospiraceae bacterium]|nr:site-specific integrase [Lachnospiraceae bacterium]
MAKNNNRRLDSKRRVLRKGETERADGYYMYRWTDRTGKRHSIMAASLEELREKEDELQKDKSDGIRTEASNVTVNDVYDLWRNMKRGLRDNTFQNYKYMYNLFVAPDLGRYKVRTLKKSDVKRFYNKLVDERNLKIATVDSIHTVLHQVLTVAVEDGYLRNNVADNVMRELKMSRNLGNEHRRALTVPEQNLFMDYLRDEQNPYHHWYPVFAVMLGTGMRVGEVTALRWCDLDMEENLIDVNHTLVYYDHGGKDCCYSIHKPKTEAGERTIPMLDYVKEAFLMEKQNQEETGIHCITTVDGYTDFVFLNRFGAVLNQATLNKALRRIIRDCNDTQLNKGKAKVLLPRFSCHSLRHTYTTRLVEAGVNIKVVQDVLGHKDVETTLNIYTDVTKELKRKEFDSLQEKMNKTNENRNNDDNDDDEEKE